MPPTPLGWLRRRRVGLSAWPGRLSTPPNLEQKRWRVFCGFRGPFPGGPPERPPGVDHSSRQANWNPAIVESSKWAGLGWTGALQREPAKPAKKVNLRVNGPRRNVSPSCSQEAFRHDARSTVPVSAARALQQRISQSPCTSQSRTRWNLQQVPGS